MDEEKEKSTLKVALIADDWASAEFFYRRFLQDNEEQILIPGRNKAIMYDGTIVEKMAIYELYTNKNNYDQVLVCLENETNGESVVLIMKSLLMSQVPASYQFLCYEEDE
jgi:hypothetical protein